MTKKSVPASVDDAAFDCPHCGAYTTQFWFDLHAVQRDEKRPLPMTSGRVMAPEEVAKNLDWDEDQKRRVTEIVRRIHSGLVFLQKASSSTTCWNEVHNLHISRCYHCGEFSVWVGERLVDPAAKLAVPPNTDLPEDVAKDFDEARAIVGGSPRGAAALLRLCVQKLCSHLGEKGKNIDDDIAALVKKGLSPVVQQALDVVRDVGNEDVHPGTMDLRDAPSTANSLFGLVNAIAEQMISHPKHVRGLYDKLPQSKRDAIDKRDGKPSGT